MPIIFKVRSVVFYFYSREHSPVHVHVRSAELKAKIEIDSGKVVYNRGFTNKDIRIIRQIVESEKEYIKEFWYEYFKNKK
jgi:hypothetical protein